MFLQLLQYLDNLLWGRDRELECILLLEAQYIKDEERTGGPVLKSKVD